MDVNGARFALLLGEPDWGRCLFASAEGWQPLAAGWAAIAAARDDEFTRAVAVTFDADRQDLALREEISVFRAPPADRAVTPDDRRGAAADRNGNVYLVDAARAGIQVLSSGSGKLSAFGPSPLAPRPAAGGDFAPAAAAAPAPAAFAGAAVTSDDYLVVGSVVPAGLQVFDLVAGGPPAVLDWPPALPFVPFDIATRPDGGVWVLDRVNRRCWELDRRFALCMPDPASPPPAMSAPDFGPADGSSSPAPAASAPPLALTAVAALALDAADPVAVETLPDNTLLVLDRGSGTSRVQAYRGGRRVDGDDPSLKLDFVAHDFVFVAGSGDAAHPGRLLVADSQGNQAFAFDLLVAGGAPRLVPSADFYPLRRFGGKALVAGPDRPWYDFGERWVPLVAQQRANYATAAEIVSPVFDSALPQTTWHRLLLDACIPPGTSVQVWTRAAEERDSPLLGGDWNAEPAPYLRASGPEIAWSRPWGDVALDRSTGNGSWELLFQRARGRYLQIRLVLGGNRRATPRLRALRAWFPRFSYAERFLPAVYREEPVSASFVERLLANFEGTLTELEGRIANVQALFDVRSVPPETIGWLADWFAIALDPAWDERRQRLFLRHTSDFFRWRGTLRALKMALHLAFDPQFDEQALVPSAAADERLQDIRIVERYLLRRAPAATFGDAQDTEGLRVVGAGGRWTPAEGNAGLVRRYAQAVLGRDASAAEEASAFALTPPADSAAAAAWTGFVQQALGFVPDLTQTARWQAFLQRRYLRVSALNAAYAAAFGAFAEIALPASLPPDGAAQLDWYDFQARVLAMLATAHRFRVLLPSPDINLGVAEASKRKDLATRIVKLEKPAHTSFDVGFYWAMFRIDEARLGLDTLLDVGSRAPQLVPDAVLGRSYVGESFLGGPPPPPTPDRVRLAC